MPLLQTKGLGIRFGGLQALQDVNLTVNNRRVDRPKRRRENYGIQPFDRSICTHRGNH